MKKILLVLSHISTGGMPQVALKKIQNLISTYDVFVVEYSDITAGLFIVQKTQIKNILSENRFTTLGSNKSELLTIIDNFNPDYIHFEEFPEQFVDFKLLSKIYDNNRNYYISETTHDVTFNPVNKKFLPDKFMHVSKFIANKYIHLNVPYEIIEYPIEHNIRPDRDIALREMGLDPKYKHVLNVGLFTPGKNQSYIFDIARKMKDENILFHFVGNQAGNFMNYWGPLMKDKPDNCIIHGERSDVSRFYECMDLFLFTSVYELNPIVIKEAISHDMKILMYNLDVYEGTYNSNPNIKYLSSDITENINLIKNVLYENTIIYPKKCYITHTTKNYVDTTFGLIYSILQYSNYPILIFTVNFDINEVSNPFKDNKSVHFIKYINDLYPIDAILTDTDHGKYVDRSCDSTYRILSMKPKLLLEAFNLGVECGIYLDSDSIARYNIDDLMLELHNVKTYPLFTRGVYDIMLDKNGNGNIEKPLMDYLNVKERSMSYVQTNVFAFNVECNEFISQWNSICEDENVLSNFSIWAPYQDETIANVLLWKLGCSDSLPMYHFNIRNLKFVEEFEKFDDTDKSKYSENMLGFPFYIDGEQMQWSYIPYNKEMVKIFHGLKNIDEIIDVIEYQNRIKNDFCIIQTCDFKYKPLAEITFKNNIEYCKKHGYDFIQYTNNINLDKSAYWQKYLAIKRHIRNYKWILYLDADCMIMNYNIKLEDLVDDNFDIIMENMGDNTDISDPVNSLYINPKYNVIASAMLYKNSDISMEFINDVYNNKLKCNEITYDNSSVRCVLSQDKYSSHSKIYDIDSKKLNSVWYSNKPSFILIDGPKWNDNKNIYNKGDFILHLVGYDITDRISLIKQFIPYIIGK